MRIIITNHANERMRLYNISKAQVFEAINTPDNVILGHSGRKIAQKRINSHILRIIIEERYGITKVITVYKAGSDRYEV
ncbi:hypothetical protein COT30_00460 [Candidatus Micrarchaeota archaeon CG08_land_8_20_14_0_20_49_17]|nr:MAG: hypothetical protein AUJ13_03065 [Candidatus Micrarchaeota archaeon CG1_02_49_24]PIU10206.1 MAG: hypothetical protein COT30_00460 [Candidatus Micrarchaeota archaeon CG08_land_8_20_14_0_20_49_17]PIU82436.1 MAG: hypothetical protein COS70_01335 [Candidatus Micrarchaeota archaeon CG06_land_8_20_14_3_00_50_6]PJA00203.1 MAG: hypothetical protein COX84_00060 [Candidatus Micrarchaeota archaeon CG_4_10_14_0_2_um_filter_49_7]HII53806.1 DUF4258 domain-containing protein [Candidatus Micrarchaeota 